MASNIQVNNIQRLRFYAEPNGSLGVDHSGTPADFYDIPFVEGSCEVKMDETIVSPEFARQDRDEHPKEVFIKKSGSIVFTALLLRPTARAGNGVAILHTPVGRLLACVMGGANLGMGDTVNDAAATASSFVVTNISRWKAGGALGWADANGVLHCREIKTADVGASKVYLKQALPSAPANSDVIYNCVTYYLDNMDADNVKTAQFILEGLGTSDGGFNDCWVLLGGQLTSVMKLDTKNGELPKYTFTFTFADWLTGEDAAYTPGALTPAGYNWTQTTVKAATTANITLANSQTIDGVAVVNPNRVLVKNQTTTKNNGIYVVVDAGAWTRATDMDSTAEMENAAVSVDTGGTVNGGHWFTQTEHAVVVGTDANLWADQGDTLDEMTYTDSVPVAIVDSYYRIAAVGSTTLTGTDRPASEYSIEPQFKYVPITSPGGVNNICAYVIDAAHPKVQGKFTVPYEDHTYLDYRDDKTDLALFFQIGSSSTEGAILITCPTIQITDFARKAVGEISGQEITWKGRRDIDTTYTVATVMAKSPIRIHVF